MTEIVTPAVTPVVDPAPVVDPLKPAEKVYDQAYVTGLRDEAAAARVSKNEAVASAVAAAKAEHEAALAAKDVAYTELQNELGAAWVELEKLYVSIDAEIPSTKVRAFTAILQGNDHDSIFASAKSTYELFDGFDTPAPKSPAYDPSQSTGGKPTLALNGDPIMQALIKAVS
ncbi:head assembly protein [Mycobacterium sp. Root265]|uniref:hypothetical protein n=1 Tax=Mycobacterium sp. Root265 TaxID=1736504 RepID=UPI00070CD466|nr:hypothetical protein [Mycobacterium sp. Root265]KRD08577.1 head assembly protein [Mycobacterium sp. Root265]